MVSTCLQLLDRISVYYSSTISLLLYWVYFAPLLSYIHEEFSEETIEFYNLIHFVIRIIIMVIIHLFIIPFCISLLSVGSEGENRRLFRCILQ